MRGDGPKLNLRSDDRSHVNPLRKARSYGVTNTAVSAAVGGGIGALTSLRRGAGVCEGFICRSSLTEKHNGCVLLWWR